MDHRLQALGRRLPLFGFILAVEGLLGCFPVCGYGIVHYTTVFIIFVLGVVMMFTSLVAPGRSTLRSLIVLSLLAVGLVHLGNLYASYLLAFLPRITLLAPLGELLMAVAAPGLWAAAIVSPGETVSRWARRSALLALAGLSVSAFKDLMDLPNASNFGLFFKLPPILLMAAAFRTVERVAILLVCILFLRRSGDRAAARICARFMTVWFVSSFIGGLAVIVYGHVNYDYPATSFYWWKLTQDSLVLTATLCIALALKDAGDGYISTATAHS